jgi:hypothetical protein
MEMNIFSKLLGSKNKKKNTARNGRWKEYNRFGIMIADGQYKNGLREGTWKIYSDAGNLVIEEEYVTGFSRVPTKHFMRMETRSVWDIIHRIRETVNSASSAMTVS